MFARGGIPHSERFGSRYVASVDEEGNLICIHVDDCVTVSNRSSKMERSALLGWVKEMSLEESRRSK